MNERSWWAQHTSLNRILAKRAVHGARNGEYVIFGVAVLVTMVTIGTMGQIYVADAAPKLHQSKNEEHTTKGRTEQRMRRDREKDREQ